MTKQLNVGLENWNVLFSNNSGGYNCLAEVKFTDSDISRESMFMTMALCIICSLVIDNLDD